MQYSKKHRYVYSKATTRLYQLFDEMNSTEKTVLKLITAADEKKKQRNYFTHIWPNAKRHAPRFIRRSKPCLSAVSKAKKFFSLKDVALVADEAKFSTKQHRNRIRRVR